ncbi:MAG: hypothetical protein KMY50_00550 [Candidatus Desulforudis sp.]|nr:hypothetical protein [Desulforudis sp.]
MKRLALLIMAICLLVAGCANPLGANDAEKVLRQYFEFCRDARPIPVSTPIRPYVEFQFNEEQAIMSDKVYNAIVFGEEVPSRKDFATAFVIPLIEYDIISTEQDANGRTIIKVSVTKYEDEEFIGEILGGYYGDLDIGVELEERQDEIERFLADKLVGDFERNYRNAFTVSTFKDEVSYVLERVNGEFKIIWDETVSERAEREKADAEQMDAEWKQQMQEEADKLAKVLPYLSVAKASVKDYRPDAFFVEVVVKNRGDIQIGFMDGLYLEIELLDENGKAISSDRHLISELQPNFTEKALLYFKDHETVDWSGKYRLRIGNQYHDLYTEWFYY